ncbi:MAG: hypothetical protein C4547_07605 [Phycisphaerales bacterium]|nr:MAG: hypothetical protein C4547_07605 [Phycisphaerales bacterium]
MTLRHPFGRLGSIAVLAALALQGGCVDMTPQEPDPDDPAQRIVDRPGSGAARVSGVVLSATSEDVLPIGGVLIILGDASAVSRVDGTFDLLSVPGGSQPLVVDGSHLVAGDGRYGQFVSRVEVEDQKQVQLEQPVYIPFVPDAALQPVSLEREATITGPDGVTLTIPPAGARVDGEAWDGRLAIIAIPPERVPWPLPDALADSSVKLLTIQPAGIEFPVPARLTIDDGGAGDAGALMLLTLDPASGAYVDRALLEGSVGAFRTRLGGVEGGGWHVLTRPRVSVIAPCPARTAEAESACLRAWMDAVDAFSVVPPPAAPGADVPLATLGEAMALAPRSAAEARTIIRAVTEDYNVVRAVTSAADGVYRGMSELDGLGAGIEAAFLACAEVTACGGSPGRGALDEALAQVQENAAAFAPPYARLAAATAALSPYFSRPQDLDDAALAAYRVDADAFVQALAAFGSSAAPMAAYDALIVTRREVERALLAQRAAFSRPAESDEAAPVSVAGICTDEGTRSYGLVAAGMASIQLTPIDPESSEACVFVAMDAGNERVSRPILQSSLLAGTSMPITLALDRRLTRASYVDGTPVAGELDPESPVHVWSFDALERDGVDVAFVSDGAAAIGVTTGASPPHILRRGGFHVSNLPGDGSRALHVIALEPDRKLPYAFTAALDAPRFEFGQPVRGTFDIMRRAEVVLFQAEAGDRVTVERTCCDNGRPNAAFSVFDPVGVQLTPIDANQPEPGTGAESFLIESPGVHRVLLSAAEGAFGDYELVVRRAAVEPPRKVPFDETIQAEFAHPGAAAVFAFTGAAGQRIAIEGVSTTGPEAVAVTVIAPDGTRILQSTLLYFDDSSFARRTFDLPADGVYTLSLTVPLLADMQTGSVEFRLTAVAGDDDPTPVH